MTPPECRCRATTRDGAPCKAPPNLVDALSGYCASHDPERREALREAARRGGAATARRLQRSGLNDAELPALNSPEAAELWLEKIGRAVATGRLGHQESRSATAAVREWLKAHEAGKVSGRLDRLREQLEQLKASR